MSTVIFYVKFIFKIFVEYTYETQLVIVLNFRHFRCSVMTIYHLITN
jgi:hypothetical protein